MTKTCDTACDPVSAAPPKTGRRPERRPDAKLDLERLVWDPEYREETRSHWRRGT